MKILTIFFFISLYCAVKRVLETMVADESPKPIDNSRITYDVIRGISLPERRERLASGYYYKR